MTVRRVLGELRARGTLLQSDRELPNVASLVTGEPIVGSWWSHPNASAVHWVLEDLDESPDVVQAKLVNGKVTLIHRALWPELFSVATCGEPWQRRGLSKAAASLLHRVRRRGSIRVDQLQRWSWPVKPGAAALELEKRLLVHSREIHTESGKHSKCLETWESRIAREELSGTLPSVADAKLALERATASAARLPWR